MRSVDFPTPEPPSTLMCLLESTAKGVLVKKSVPMMMFMRWEMCVGPSRAVFYKAFARHRNGLCPSAFGTINHYDMRTVFAVTHISQKTN
jgi:hypothetical protein